MDNRTKIVLLVNLLVVLSGVVLTQISMLEIKDVGVSLIASGLVTLFYFAYPKTTVEEEYHKLTKNKLTATYVTRDLKEEYSALLNSASKKIDVLGLGLNKFREDNGEIVKQKCLQGVQVRFLVIDPESDSFKMRNLEEGDKMGETIRAPQEKLLEYVADTNQAVATKAAGKKIQIKYYKSSPTTMIFRIDDVMFVGPYLHKRVSRNTCTFKLEKGELFSQYEDHFEKLWNDLTITRIP
jgi:hypothetical protein